MPSKTSTRSGATKTPKRRRSGATKTPKRATKTSTRKKKTSGSTPSRFANRLQMIPLHKVKYPGFYLGLRPSSQSICIATKSKKSNHKHTIIEQMFAVWDDTEGPRCVPRKINVKETMNGTRFLMSANEDVPVMTALQKTEWQEPMAQFQLDYNKEAAAILTQFPLLSCAFVEQNKLPNKVASIKALVSCSDDLIAWLKKRLGEEEQTDDSEADDSEGAADDDGDSDERAMKDMPSGTKALEAEIEALRLKIRLITQRNSQVHTQKTRLKSECDKKQLEVVSLKSEVQTLHKQFKKVKRKRHNMKWKDFVRAIQTELIPQDQLALIQSLVKSHPEAAQTIAVSYRAQLRELDLREQKEQFRTWDHRVKCMILCEVINLSYGKHQTLRHLMTNTSKVVKNRDGMLLLSMQSVANDCDK